MDVYICSGLDFYKNTELQSRKEIPKKACRAHGERKKKIIYCDF